MQVDVQFLENMRLEAAFDDYKITTDQPIRYKGDATAPSPFDYFLASSALCAAYFVKIYCQARNIDTQDISITQQNIVDPDNRYQQIFQLEIDLPESITSKDKEGILKAMDRCAVKRVIQNNPGFDIQAKSEHSTPSLKDQSHLNTHKNTTLVGKDSPLEETIDKLSNLLNELGIKIEIASWRNPIPYVWSVHIRDADSPICYTNGKGSSKEAALASALGEYIERIGNNYFYNDYYLGHEIAKSSFVHYPEEKWFKIPDDNNIPSGLMDKYLKEIYNLDGQLKANHLVDTNSANIKRGICALPFIRQSDNKKTYIPVNLIGNLFVSNGMSAGNSKDEARVQCLSEIFERAIKTKIIKDEITLPDIPQKIINRYPQIRDGINTLKDKGFPIIVKDASLGGRFPVICVTLMNPKTGGVFASFGSHPRFEVALERSLTELMQGRSFEGMNEMPAPTFNQHAVIEHNNIVDHFIDSSGVISWKFFSSKEDFEFVDWDFIGNTKEEFDYLMNIFHKIEKEVYIADYDKLGAYACRILVPDYSEIYEKEDLIWDNNNRALNFRDDILNIHTLTNDELNALYDQLEESELDDYMPISELIGMAFETTSTWGQLDIGELKAQILLSLQDYQGAKQWVEMFLTFNDNLPERKRYYQLLNILLDIELNDSIDLQDYKTNLIAMYGKGLFEETFKTISGEIRFHGLVPTDIHFKDLDKHQDLIKSYQKLHFARSKYFRH